MMKGKPLVAKLAAAAKFVVLPGAMVAAVLYSPPEYKSDKYPKQVRLLRVLIFLFPFPLLRFNLDCDHVRDLAFSSRTYTRLILFCSMLLFVVVKHLKELKILKISVSSKNQVAGAVRTFGCLLFGHSMLITLLAYGEVLFGVTYLLHILLNVLKPRPGPTRTLCPAQLLAWISTNLDFAVGLLGLNLPGSLFHHLVKLINHYPCVSMLLC